MSSSTSIDVATRRKTTNGPARPSAATESVRATDGTRIKNRNKRSRILKLCALLLKANLTADYTDTRGWAVHLVRTYPRVSASSAVLFLNRPDKHSSPPAQKQTART